MKSYKNLLFKQFVGAVIVFVSVCAIAYAAFSFDWRVGVTYLSILAAKIGYSMMDNKI